MRAFNHIAGGVAFSGLFCSLADVNVFASLETVSAAVFFSVLPDVDHTRSAIGKAFYPLSKWLQKRYGHRTITHSLVFFTLLSMVLFLLAPLVSNGRSFAIIGTFAYGSHLIFDMCTKQGVKFFYPFSSRPAVLPADPDLRLAYRDVQTESVIFLIFISTITFSYPLMKEGFWTKYNKFFLTFDHLKRELKTKPGTYYVIFKSDGIKEGYLYDINNQHLKVLNQYSTEIESYEIAESSLKDFTLTKAILKDETEIIKGVSLDSVNRFQLGKRLTRIQVQCNQDFKYKTGIIENVTKIYEGSEMQFFEQVFKADSTVTDRKILTHKIEALQSNFQKELKLYEAAQNEYQNLKLKLTNLHDETVRLQKLKEFDLNRLQQPQPPDIYEYETKLQALTRPEPFLCNCMVQYLKFKP